MNQLAFAIIGHMVGDYLLQNDWMAQGKKRSNLICAFHCAVWTLCVMSFANWWAWWIGAALFFSHFAQDRTPFIAWFMRNTGREKFSQPPMAPWSFIVVDNTYHLVALAMIARLLGGAT